MLINGTTTFPGSFTLKRGNLKSQNDWIIVSKVFLQNTTDLNLVSDLSDISDQLPLQSKFKLKACETLEQVNQSIDDILDEKNNHIRVKKLKPENINMDIFYNIMSTYINKMKNNVDVADVTTLYSEIEISIKTSVKDASNISQNRVATIIKHQANDSTKESIICDNKNEYNTWKFLLGEKDPKKYNAILFANNLESRCSLPYQHSNYSMNLKTIWKAVVRCHISIVITKKSNPIYSTKH